MTAAAVALIGLFALMFLSGPEPEASSADDTLEDDPPPVTTTTTENATTSTTEPLPTDPFEIGEAWLASIVDSERERFIALHEDGFQQANETLMMWGWHSNRPGAFADRYFEGFDAFQASLDVDDDEILEQGCRPAGDNKVFCILRTTLIGERETSGIGAVLTVDPAVGITNVRLDLGSTEPSDLFGYWQNFLAEEATERDIGCADIGFNSVECGIHESNVLRRYIDFYRSRSTS